MHRFAAAVQRAAKCFSICLSRLNRKSAHDLPDACLRINRQFGLGRHCDIDAAREDPALAARYQLLYSGKFADVPRDAWQKLAIETAPPGDANDSKFVQVGLYSVALVIRK